MGSGVSGLFRSTNKRPSLDHEALAKEIKNSQRYRPGCAAQKVSNFEGLCFIEAARLLEKSDNMRHRAAGYYGLSRCLVGESKKSGTQMTRDGRSMSERELLLEAVACDPQCAPALCALSLLADGQVVCLRDGRRLTRNELLLLAVAADRDCADAYDILAAGLEGTLLLPDGRTMDAGALLWEAVRCDPGCAGSVVTLANHVSRVAESEPHTTETLPDGRAKTVATAVELYVSALRLDPHYELAYFNLCRELSDYDTVLVPALPRDPTAGPRARPDTDETGTRRMTRQGLLLETLRCMGRPLVAGAALPSYFEDLRIRTLYNLGKTMKNNDTVTLPCGTVRTRKQLVDDIKEIEPKSCFARWLEADIASAGDGWSVLSDSDDSSTTTESNGTSDTQNGESEI
eukprot:m.43974 g.43974  ORF g.43974 m.43974 type:complete len:402 (-) comp10851_c0_seq1:251-1456(-)